MEPGYFRKKRILWQTWLRKALRSSLHSFFIPFQSSPVSPVSPVQSSQSSPVSPVTIHWISQSFEKSRTMLDWVLRALLWLVCSRGTLRLRSSFLGAAKRTKKTPASFLLHVAMWFLFTGDQLFFHSQLFKSAFLVFTTAESAQECQDPCLSQREMPLLKWHSDQVWAPQNTGIAKKPYKTKRKVIFGPLGNFPLQLRLGTIFF